MTSFASHTMTSSGVRKYESLYVAGRWSDRAGRNVLQSIEPATGLVWAEVPEADETDVDEAVDSAQRALRGPWGQMPGAERGRFLFRVAELLSENAEYFAELECRDTGTPIQMAVADVHSAAVWFRYFAGATDKIQGSAIPSNPNWHSYTRREPVGVVAAIVPWNVPLLMCAFKLAPALAAGCTVVLKPAELTPITALELAGLMEQAGVPNGVMSVLPGLGESVGAALVRHPHVNKVSFTGEASTARTILREAAANMTRVSIEAGGKAPQIIFRDADLDKAVNSVTTAAFRRSGQSCTAGSRIFVQREIAEEFLAGMKAIAAEIVVGDPRSSGTQLGPQTSEVQLSKTLQYIDIGRDEGARLEFGGDQPQLSDPSLSNGYFIRPTIFSEVSNSMKIAQEEIFGPVASVMTFDDEDEVIKLANDVAYGLTAGLWTRDVGRAHRVASAIEAGSVWVNVYPALHAALPYGGLKQSGIGREHGIEAVHEYTEVKTVVVDISGDSQE